MSAIQYNRHGNRNFEGFKKGLLIVFLRTKCKITKTEVLTFANNSIWGF